MKGRPVRSLAIMLGVVMVNFVVLSACGGGGGGGVVIAPMGNFTNSDLSGTYAFNYQGSDAAGAPFAAAGQFTANGSGAITGGAIDLNDQLDGFLFTPATILGTSNYKVSPDGETSVTLNLQSGQNVLSLDLQLTLASGDHGLISAFDLNFSGSGAIDKQVANPAIPTSANVAFALSGVDTQFLFQALFGGNIAINASGNILAGSSIGDVVSVGEGILDTGDTSLTGSIAADNNNPGRAIVQISSSSIPDTFTFAVYVVDSTHVKVVEVDTTSFFLMGGEAFLAPGTGNQQLQQGNYSYTFSGQTGKQGTPFGAGGVLTTDGSGNITGGVQDLNNATQLFLAQQMAKTSYTSSASFARLDMTLNNGHAIMEFATYPTSQNMILMTEIDGNNFGSGIGYKQNSTAALHGNYAVNLTGFATNQAGDFVQDAVGQINVSSMTVTGTLMINNLFARKANDALLTETLSNSTAAAPDASGLGRGNPLSLQAAALGANGYSTSYFTVDGNRVLLVEMDKVRVSTGQLLAQSE